MYQQSLGVAAHVLRAQDVVGMGQHACWYNRMQLSTEALKLHAHAVTKSSAHVVYEEP